MWRGAFLNNAAAGHAGIDDLFPAYATYGSSSGILVWPGPNMRGMGRNALHNCTTATIDDIFTMLQYTHSLYIIYTHGCDEVGGTNTTYVLRDYFLGKIDVGLAGGWLEFTTFSKLAAEIGWYWATDITTRQRYIATPLLDGTTSKYYQPTYRCPIALTRSAIGQARTVRT
jgi:hypothetical protein